MTDTCIQVRESGSAFIFIHQTKFSVDFMPRPLNAETTEKRDDFLDLALVTRGERERGRERGGEREAMSLAQGGKRGLHVRLSGSGAADRNLMTSQEDVG